MGDIMELGQLHLWFGVLKSSFFRVWFCKHLVELVQGIRRDLIVVLLSLRFGKNLWLSELLGLKHIFSSNDWSLLNLNHLGLGLWDDRLLRNLLVFNTVLDWRYLNHLLGLLLWDLLLLSKLLLLLLRRIIRGSLNLLWLLLIVKLLWDWIDLHSTRSRIWPKKSLILCRFIGFLLLPA